MMTSVEEQERLTIAGGEVINDIPSNIKQTGLIEFQHFNSVRIALNYYQFKYLNMLV